METASPENFEGLTTAIALAPLDTDVIQQAKERETELVST
jgi:hypothetical protein